MFSGDCPSKDRDISVSGPPRPRTPGYFFRVEKVTKKTLKKLRFLRIFLDYGGFYLRYDLVASISPITSLGRCRSHLRHNSLDLRLSSLGSPPRSTILRRDYRATGMVRAVLPCYAGAYNYCQAFNLCKGGLRAAPSKTSVLPPGRPDETTSPVYQKFFPYSLRISEY